MFKSKKLDSSSNSSLSSRLKRLGVGALAGVIGLNMALAPLAAPAEAAPLPLPTFISVNDVTVVEPDLGFVNATFRLRLSAARPFPVSVHYQTMNGTALAGPDYIAKAGIAVFPPGTTVVPVSVQVRGDLLDENNEAFRLVLSAPVGGVIADGLGIGTILDNDPAPRLSISNASRVEGNAGTVDMTFNVSLSAPSAKPVAVNYQTVNGSAQSSAILPFLKDFLATSGTLHFAPGQVNKTIVVKIVGNLIPEPTENFTVHLSAPVNASIADGIGVGTIFDNDRILAPHAE